MEMLFGYFSMFVSLAVVVLRFVLLSRFFVYPISSAWVFGLSEALALGFTVRGLVRFDRDSTWSGLLVPIAYLSPLLFVPAGWCFPGASLLLLVVGFFVCFLRLWFAGAVSVGVPTFGGLVDRGPWGLVRHPMAGVEVVMCWCFFLSHVSAVNAFVVVLCTGWIFFAVICEERFLVRFGSYREYCERVKWRWLPGVW